MFWQAVEAVRSKFGLLRGEEAIPRYIPNQRRERKMCRRDWKIFLTSRIFQIWRMWIYPRPLRNMPVERGRLKNSQKADLKRVNLAFFSLSFRADQESP
jgi:hypothetical protein